MNITMIGTGYVGLVTGACLADMGNDVLCVDVDQGKIERLLRGEIPIHEPGLDNVVHRNMAAGRLRFSADPREGALFGVIQMIAVGTPPDEDGSADLSYVLAAARSIAQNMDAYRCVVDKSTVPVGTGDKVQAVITEELQKRGVELPFSVASNPEFLKEGAAVDDFMKPDRIVLGVEDAEAEQILRELYAPFQRNHERTFVMRRRAAELTKYAANAMLATRISFMNELSRLAEKVGVDIEQVRVGIGSDSRIGYSFLYAGAGYGGSCFPKDVKALIRSTQEQGIEPVLLQAVESVNQSQKLVLVQKAIQRFGNLKGLRFGVWGLAFKPNTDDMREAASRVIIEALWSEGADIIAYDPVAMDECRRIYGDHPHLSLAGTPLEAARGVDALFILTEWKEFRSPNFQELRQRMKAPVIFDGRNLYEPQMIRDRGFEYWAIGRP
ncbi:MAG: UDP-glucose/GDP-mannose dehydrogenase family protein [Betaproteobacteria bacterium]|jgi:UDPglucose 6-dehydrogenase|nr:UDP-glucose/GDP-mannose dehydrogenase family protein [Betaproteobacteria bacterium]NBP33995.1 UDP-glucose/GDP-mannose dehydrogenase family protein [Betaproteobacteria bacterium]NBP36968.1 UDP-glucose/GDP-mannose dehydrogenase family protein [Betaproteobacteria bacterium]NBQ77293.1 UDP-glucose/GDP-mannose dehydrogenase family protein [Betaproteobacteria bacterium]NBQ94031.1 UDP-glucose/GDP-mannose dehydrogenase family protein [Betaproteobacteria bacterium]